MRTFIAAIGSGDGSPLGDFVKERLAGDAPLHAARVVMDDLATDPMEVAERLHDEWPLERVIFVGSVARARPAGSLAAYRWDRESPNESPNGDGDGSLFDSTLLALRGLADLPDDVIVVEIEPEDDGGFDQSVPEATLERAQALLRRLATSSRAADSLPTTALGGL